MIVADWYRDVIWLGLIPSASEIAPGFSATPKESLPGNSMLQTHTKSGSLSCRIREEIIRKEDAIT
jgi:hypothetical protein